MLHQYNTAEVLLKFSSTKICPHHSFSLRSPLATKQRLHSIQNSFHLLPHCFWYSSPYLSNILHLYSPSCSLRSAADTRIFHVPRMGRRTLGERSFQYTGPVLWNPLPLSVRHLSSLSSCKSKLKTISSPLHTDLSFYQFIHVFVVCGGAGGWGWGWAAHMRLCVCV